MLYDKKRPSQKKYTLILELDIIQLPGVLNRSDRQNGSSSGKMLPVLQEQALPQVSVLPWCARSQDQDLRLGPQDVTGTARTSPTPSLGSAVVCQIPRSGSTTWAARRLMSTISLSASTWSPTSTSSCPLRPLRLAVFAATSTW